MPFLQACKIPLPYVLMIVAVAVLFAVFPSIDLAVSAMIYHEPTGQFPLEHNPAAAMVSFLFNAISVLFVLVVAGLVAWAWWKRKPYFPTAKRVGAYFIVLFALGPVLLVSLGLKEQWGRARPVDVQQFGGAAQFTPYYMPSDQCQSDCSFPSGHTSRGFYFISLYFVAAGIGLSGRRQRAILAGTVAYGSFAALTRLLEGNHFLSDVTASAILITYLAWVLYRWIEPFESGGRITSQPN